MTIKRKTLILIVSYAAAFAVAVTWFLIEAANEHNRLRLQIENQYSMNLSELDGSLGNISVALKKAVYATTATQLNSLAVELCTESTVAKNSLSGLPYSGEELSGVNKFLSQVGDYTLYLSKRVIQGENLSDDEQKNLRALSDIAKILSQHINTVRTEYDKAGVWDDTFTAQMESTVTLGFNDTMTGLEELLVDYPSLVYDGPFSDHMLNGNSKMIENAKEISETEARKIAAQVFASDVSELSEATETDGKIATYDYNTGDKGVSVSKMGGYVVYYRNFQKPGQELIGYDEAVARATGFINSQSSDTFVSTYYFVDEGVCTVNFAYKAGAVICYPDLIKIGVSLENGEIVSIEAAGYLANHYTRTIPTPKYSVETAKGRLSKTLNVKSSRRVVIPVNGNTEKHCFEFDCTGIDGEELLVYVNTSTLEEEEIMLLLKTDGGTLTK